VGRRTAVRRPTRQGEQDHRGISRNRGWGSGRRPVPQRARPFPRSPGGAGGTENRTGLGRPRSVFASDTLLLPANLGTCRNKSFSGNPEPRPERVERGLGRVAPINRPCGPWTCGVAAGKIVAARALLLRQIACVPRRPQIAKG
jgi:hypothetical protein